MNEAGNGQEQGDGRQGRPLTLTKKDFTSDQEVRWCPGCGDYAILAAVQGFMPELGLPTHQTVFVDTPGVHRPRTSDPRRSPRRSGSDPGPCRRTRTHRERWS